MEQQDSHENDKINVKIEVPFEDFPIDEKKHELAQKYRYAVILFCLQSVAILLQERGTFPLPSAKTYSRFTNINYKSLLRYLKVLEEAGACTILREKEKKNKLKIIPKSVEYYQEIIDKNPIMFEHKKKFDMLRGTW